MHVAAPLPDVRRIAVLRANGIGDFVFALPALEALRTAYPDAEITLLGLPLHVELLAGRPGPVDRVLVVPPLPGLTVDSTHTAHEGASRAFFEEMRAYGFDLALQMHGGGRHSNSVVRRLGARTTVGFRTPDAAALDRELPYAYYQPEVFRFLELAALAGAPPRSFEPRLDVTAADHAAAAPLLPDGAAPLVLVHPGAGDARRRWPAACFAALAALLVRRRVQVALVGSVADRPLAEDILAALPSEARAGVTDLTARLSLPGLVGALDAADVVLGNDSGPLHLAEAVGTPTVGIYWCGNMINGAPVLRRRHRQLISWRVECPACGAPCTGRDCGHRASFVADVPAHDVASEVFRLLSADTSASIAR